ncbi:MAG TPA: hypothetical protein VFD37_00775, partial [Solirubrobacterales bacterium]|nr:hypothetical protein [Solirubrobacterales bacterium]
PAGRISRKGRGLEGAPPSGGQPAGGAPSRPRPFRLILPAGLALVVLVVAIAFITGTADDLPWGALIGVVVLLGAMAVTGRRRERRMREAFPDDEE